MRPFVRCCCCCCCCRLPNNCSCCFIAAAALLLIAVSCQAALTALLPGCSQLLCCCNCCCCCLLRMLGRTIVCRVVLPLPRLELATAPLALINQQLSLLGRTCLTRPRQDNVAASLSFLRTLICSLDKDRCQTGRIHLDCPCPPIPVLQPPTTGADFNFL